MVYDFPDLCIGVFVIGILVWAILLSFISFLLGESHRREDLELNILKQGEISMKKRKKIVISLVVCFGVVILIALSVALFKVLDSTYSLFPEERFVKNKYMLFFSGIILLFS